MLIKIFIVLTLLSVEIVWSPRLGIKDKSLILWYNGLEQNTKRKIRTFIKILG